MAHRIRWARLVTVLFTALVATAGAVATAGLAHAEGSATTRTHSTGATGSEVVPPTSGDCLYVLNRSGYPTTAARAEACNIGAGGGWAGVPFCRVKLQDTGVSAYVSGLACNAAAD